MDKMPPKQNQHAVARWDGRVHPTDTKEKQRERVKAAKWVAQ